MEKTLFTLALAVLFTAVVGQSSCTGMYTNENGDWSAEWYVSSDYLSATFTVTARTDGWVGIGFSMNRMMANSDIIVGAASADGRQYFVSDRYADSRTAPLVDENQNITDITARQETMNGQTYTIITFRRPICSNNEPNDVALSEKPYLLFAWGSVINFNPDDRNNIRGHSQATRGISDMTINFICNATQGSHYEDLTGTTWEAWWNVSPDASYVTFTVMAATEGWVGIGFSLDRNMAGSDIIVGASDGANNSYVSDRYAVSQTNPEVDAYQDITSQSAMQMEVNGTNYTVITFTRRTISEDQRDISLDQEIYILSAWGPEGNFNASDEQSIQYHGAGRGASMESFTFFRCGVVVAEPRGADTDPPTTATTAAGAAVSVTTALVIVLLLVTLMNTLI